MKDKAFRPIKKSIATASTHPKTINNRKYNTAKRGLELALKRADGAFRMSKSRKLRELHLSKQWSQLSEADRVNAKKDIIAALEAHRDEKKRLCELEWMRGVQTGEYSEEEVYENEENDVMEEIEYENSGEVRGTEWNDSDWSTCTEEEDASVPTTIHGSTFREGFEEIKQAFAEG